MNAIYRLDVKDSFHIIVFCFYILQNIQKEITNPTAIRSICANIQIYMDLQPNIIQEAHLSHMYGSLIVGLKQKERTY